MASSKARTSIWAAQTLTAGAGNTTSSWIDINTAYGAQLNIKLSNGGTGPTIPAQVQIVVSNDTGHTLSCNLGGALIGSITLNVVSSWSIELPLGVCSFQLVAGSNTVQAVTVDADVSVVTGI